jgi:hypothetical protein
MNSKTEIEIEKNAVERGMKNDANPANKLQIAMTANASIKCGPQRTCSLPGTILSVSLVNIKCSECLGNKALSSNTVKSGTGTMAIACTYRRLLFCLARVA